MTKDEISAMIKAADHPRDKALVSLIYDSGARMGEITNLKIKNINFDGSSARITLDGKTGIRTIAVVMSVPDIASWLEIHPNRDDPDFPLWVNIGTNGRGEPVTYRALANTLRKIAKKAGIKKNVYPHLFRHSRATELANYLTEAQLEAYMGWVPGSDMARVYVHLADQDANRAILTMHGIKQQDEQPILTFQECHVCGTKNGPTSVRCSQCGRALDVPEHMNLEERRKQLMIKLSEFISNDNGVNTVFHESLGAV